MLSHVNQIVYFGPRVIFRADLEQVLEARKRKVNLATEPKAYRRARTG